MKKKILNWIYGICRKILATEYKPQYIFYQTGRIERHRIEHMITDEQILRSSNCFKEQIIPVLKNELLKQIETRIQVKEYRGYDELSTVYVATISTIKPNETNKTE